MPTRMVTAASLLVACCLSLIFSLSSTLSELRHEHVGGQARLGARDAEVAGPLVGHGEQPADPARDGVLGQRGVGQLAELFQAGLPVLDPQLSRDGQVLGRLAAENLQGALHPRAATAAGALRRKLASSKLASRFAVALTSRRIRRSSQASTLSCAPSRVSRALIASPSLTTTRSTPRTSRAFA